MTEERAAKEAQSERVGGGDGDESLTRLDVEAERSRVRTSSACPSFDRLSRNHSKLKIARRFLLPPTTWLIISRLVVLIASLL